MAAVREQVRALQELADYRGKLLDEAEWRYRELLEELRRSHPGDGVGGPSDRVRRVFGIRIGFRLGEWESHGQEAIGAEAQA